MRFERWILPFLYIAIFVAILLCALTTKKKEGESCIVAETMPSKEKTQGIDKSGESHLKSYIIGVINNGSDKLHTKAGAMSKGYTTTQDAPDVAEYVLHLMSKNSEVNKNGRTIYEGNCAGCHGQNGDGINGAFPRLDGERLQGIEKD